MPTTDAAKNRRLMALYRISVAEQEAIEDFQRGHQQYRLLLGGRMGTDHCHKTGLIRGRLDWRLNKSLGLIESACPSNTSDVLRALALYLDAPPATEVLGAPRYGLIGRAQFKKVMRYGEPPDCDL